ncbi:MAG TPA: TRAM domain-containing protein [Gemmatimonadaceae bacterium]|nr:TRAM domain-containing protein [Gemmatimonadaceae bacterium]
MAAGERREVEIASIAAGGDGVARADGLVVFVPRSAPGDRAVVQLTSAGRFARGALEQLTTPSPARVVPPCAHYTSDRCGGCQLQHLGYAAQLAAKQGIVRDAVTRIARRDTELAPIEPSPDEWRYRRKLTLAMRWVGDRWIAGLHPYDDPVSVFELVDCPITDGAVVAAWRDVLAHAVLLPRARALRGAIRMTDDGGAFAVEGGRQWDRAARLLDAVPSLAAVWWTPERGVRRLVADRRGPADNGRRAASASFAQVNARMAERLHAYVVARATAHAPRTVVDAYAGVGATALALARAGARVTAIELDRDAVRVAERALPVGSRALCGRTEELLPSVMPADVVLLNPPRGGLEAEVTGALEAAVPRPRAVIYVSCNAATLSRDLARLPSYAIHSLRLFDMFPQTAHVETVCELVPEAA